MNKTVAGNFQGLELTNPVTKDKFVSHDTVPLIYFDGRHEMENMREKSSIQLAFSKRQKTDLSSLEFELNRFNFL